MYSQEIFNFFQNTARLRGWPPTPLEVAKHFDLPMGDAIARCVEVRARLDELTETVEKPRQEAMLQQEVPPLKPESHPRPADIAKFTGRNGWPDAHDRAIYNFDCALNAYHRGTVDYMLHDEMICLTPETEKYLYGAESAVLPNYRPGSRPFLEQVARDVTRGLTTDRQKVSALVKFIANPKDSPYRGNNMVWRRPLGGTEEEVIKKTWHMCNEISRVLSFLCQILGMPARPVFIFTDPVYYAHGHSQTEIFFDGKWNLVEQNHGLLYPKKDGYFASIIELRDDPEIINSRADAGQMLGLSSICFRAPTSYMEYRIDDIDRYQYLWQDWKGFQYRTAGFDYQAAYGELPDINR